MERNFIYRSASLIAFLLLAVLLLPHLLVATEPDGNSAMIGNDTPQARLRLIATLLPGRNGERAFCAMTKK